MVYNELSMNDLFSKFSSLSRFGERDLSDTRPRTWDGYLVDAVNELRQRIQKERAEHVQTSSPVLNLRPDRTKTGHELASELRERLAEIGLKPQDVLVRYVRGQNWVHTPTAYTIGENSQLAFAIGASEHNSTWASPLYDSTYINIGANHPSSSDLGYIVYRASDLIRIDCVGDKYVDRPFYVFKGNPHSAVIAKIHDNGEHDLGQSLPSPKTPTQAVPPFIPPSYQR